MIGILRERERELNNPQNRTTETVNITYILFASKKTFKATRKEFSEQKLHFLSLLKRLTTQLARHGWATVILWHCIRTWRSWTRNFMKKTDTWHNNNEKWNNRAQTKSNSHAHSLWILWFSAFFCVLDISQGLDHHCNGISTTWKHHTGNHCKEYQWRSLSLLKSHFNVLSKRMLQVSTFKILLFYTIYSFLISSLEYL